MITPTNSGFLTTRDWHRAFVGGKDLILRHTSALEHLQLFSGYANGNQIEVYATSSGEHENVYYQIVETFDAIEYIQIGNVLCTSVNQTVNDMLSVLDSVDEQPLVEGLGRYYYINGQSFNGLVILPENAGWFNRIKDWAVEYYDEV